MKKTIKAIIAALCICPALMLAACGTTSYYTITAASSDILLGTVSGAFSQPRQSGGTSVNLVAKENKPNTNPFICWVKNNIDVASHSKELKLTYSGQTEGSYTAVFAEQSPQQMMYAVLKSVEYSRPGDIDRIDFTINYARTVSGSNDYIKFETGSIDDGTTYNGNKNSVIYFGNAIDVDNFRYRFSVNVALVGYDQSLTEYSFDFSEMIMNNSFDSNWEKSITAVDPQTDVEMTLTFEKLNQNTFN